MTDLLHTMRSGLERGLVRLEALLGPGLFLLEAKDSFPPGTLKVYSGDQWWIKTDNPKDPWKYYAKVDSPKGKLAQAYFDHQQALIAAGGKIPIPPDAEKKFQDPGPLKAQMIPHGDLAQFVAAQAAPPAAPPEAAPAAPAPITPTEPAAPPEAPQAVQAVVPAAEPAAGLPAAPEVPPQSADLYVKHPFEPQTTAAGPAPMPVEPAAPPPEVPPAELPVEPKAPEPPAAAGPDPAAATAVGTDTPATAATPSHPKAEISIAPGSYGDFTPETDLAPEYLSPEELVTHLAASLEPEKLQALTDKYGDDWGEKLMAAQAKVYDPDAFGGLAAADVAVVTGPVTPKEFAALSPAEVTTALNLISMTYGSEYLKDALGDDWEDVFKAAHAKVQAKYPKPVETPPDTSAGVSPATGEVPPKPTEVAPATTAPSEPLKAEPPTGSDASVHADGHVVKFKGNDYSLDSPADLADAIHHGLLDDPVALGLVKHALGDTADEALALAKKLDVAGVNSALSWAHETTKFKYGDEADLANYVTALGGIAAVKADPLLLKHIQDVTTGDWETNVSVAKAALDSILAKMQTSIHPDNPPAYMATLKGAEKDLVHSLLGGSPIYKLSAALDLKKKAALASAGEPTGEPIGAMAGGKIVPIAVLTGAPSVPLSTPHPAEVKKPSLFSMFAGVADPGFPDPATLQTKKTATGEDQTFAVEGSKAVARLFVDPKGEMWAFKPSSPPPGASVASGAWGEVMTSQLASLVNTAWPPATIGSLQGKVGSLQKHGFLASLGTADAGNLDATESLDVANMHLVDWLMGQDKMTTGQRLLRVDHNGQKRVVGLNHVNAFTDAADVVHSWPGSFYAKLWDGFANGETAAGFDPKSMLPAIEKLEAVSDDDFASALTGFIAGLPEGNPKKDPQFVTAMLARKKNLRAEFEKFITEQYKKREGVVGGTFTFEKGFEFPPGVQTAKAIQKLKKANEDYKKVMGSAPGGDSASAIFLGSIGSMPPNAFEAAAIGNIVNAIGASVAESASDEELWTLVRDAGTVSSNHLKRAYGRDWVNHVVDVIRGKKEPGEALPHLGLLNLSSVLVPIGGHSPLVELPPEEMKKKIESGSLTALYGPFAADLYNIARSVMGQPTDPSLPGATLGHEALALLPSFAHAAGGVKDLAKHVASNAELMHKLFGANWFKYAGMVCAALTLKVTGMPQWSQADAIIELNVHVFGNETPLGGGMTPAAPKVEPAPPVAAPVVTPPAPPPEKPTEPKVVTAPVITPPAPEPPALPPEPAAPPPPPPAPPEVKTVTGGTAGYPPITPLVLPDPKGAVPFPEAPDAKAMTVAVASAQGLLGGVKSKKILVDAQGRKWLFKPTGTEALNAKAGEAVAKIQSMLGGPGDYVPVWYVEGPGGKWGSIQPMLESSGVFGSGGIGHFTNDDPAAYTPETKQWLVRQRVLDWLVSNADTKGGNFLKLANGKVVGIDKERAFKEMLGKSPVDKLDLTHDACDETPIYNTLFQAYADKSIDLNPMDALPMIEQIEAISDEKYLEALKPYLDELAASSPDGDKKSQNCKANALARKHNIRADFEGFFSMLREKRGEKPKKFTFSTSATPIAVQHVPAHAPDITAWGWAHQKKDGGVVGGPPPAALASPAVSSPATPTDPVLTSPVMGSPPPAPPANSPAAEPPKPPPPPPPAVGPLVKPDGSVNLDNALIKGTLGSPTDPYSLQLGYLKAKLDANDFDMLGFTDSKVVAIKAALGPDWKKKIVQAWAAAQGEPDPYASPALAVPPPPGLTNEQFDEWTKAAKPNPHNLTTLDSATLHALDDASLPLNADHSEVISDILGADTLAEVDTHLEGLEGTPAGEAAKATLGPLWKKKLYTLAAVVALPVDVSGQEGEAAEALEAWAKESLKPASVPVVPADVFAPPPPSATAIDLDAGEKALVSSAVKEHEVYGIVNDSAVSSILGSPEEAAESGDNTMGVTGPKSARAVINALDENDPDLVDELNAKYGDGWRRKLYTAWAGAYWASKNKIPLGDALHALVSATQAATPTKPATLPDPPSWAKGVDHTMLTHIDLNSMMATSPARTGMKKALEGIGVTPPTVMSGMTDDHKAKLPAAIQALNNNTTIDVGSNAGKTYAEVYGADWKKKLYSEILAYAAPVSTVDEAALTLNKYKKDVDAALAAGAVPAAPPSPPPAAPAPEAPDPLLIGLDPSMVVPMEADEVSQAFNAAGHTVLDPLLVAIKHGHSPLSDLGPAVNALPDDFSSHSFLYGKPYKDVFGPDWKKKLYTAGAAFLPMGDWDETLPMVHQYAADLKAAAPAGAAPAAPAGPVPAAPTIDLKPPVPDDSIPASGHPLLPAEFKTFPLDGYGTPGTPGASSAAVLKAALEKLTPTKWSSFQTKMKAQYGKFWKKKLVSQWAFWNKENSDPYGKIVGSPMSLVNGIALEDPKLKYGPSISNVYSTYSKSAADLKTHLDTLPAGDPAAPEDSTFQEAGFANYMAKVYGSEWKKKLVHAWAAAKGQIDPYEAEAASTTPPKPTPTPTGAPGPLPPAPSSVPDLAKAAQYHIDPSLLVPLNAAEAGKFTGSTPADMVPGNKGLTWGSISNKSAPVDMTKLWAGVNELDPMDQANLKGFFGDDWAKKAYTYLATVALTGSTVAHPGTVSLIAKWGQEAVAAGHTGPIGGGVSPAPKTEPGAELPPLSKPDMANLNPDLVVKPPENFSTTSSPYSATVGPATTLAELEANLNALSPSLQAAAKIEHGPDWKKVLYTIGAVMLSGHSTTTASAAEVAAIYKAKTGKDLSAPASAGAAPPPPPPPPPPPSPPPAVPPPTTYIPSGGLMGSPVMVQAFGDPKNPGNPLTAVMLGKLVQALGDKPTFMPSVVKQLKETYGADWKGKFIADWAAARGEAAPAGVGASTAKAGPPPNLLWKNKTVEAITQSIAAYKKTKIGEDINGPNPDSVLLKYNLSGADVPYIKELLAKAGLTVTADKQGDTTHYFAVSKAQYDALKGKVIPTFDTGKPEPPPPPSAGQPLTYTPFVLPEHRRARALSELDGVTERKDIREGAAFDTDGIAVEGQSLLVQRLKDPSGKTFYHVLFKLRQPVWEGISGGTPKASGWKFEDPGFFNADYDAGADSRTVTEKHNNEHGNTSVHNDTYKAKRWEAGGSTLDICTDKQKYAYMGFASARLYLKPGQTVQDALKGLLNKAQPGLADKVLHQPTAAEIETMRLSKLLWSLHPQAAKGVSEADRTPAKLRAKLKSLGVSEEMMGQMEEREVVPGYQSTVLPGRWKMLHDQGFRFAFSATGANAEVLADSILGQSAGVVQRNLIGVAARGSSYNQDVNEGGGEGVCARYITQKSLDGGASFGSCGYGDVHMIYHPRVMDRLDSYANKNDGWTNCNPSAPHGHCENGRKSIESMTNTMSYSDELMLRRGVDAADIVKVACDSPHRRTAILNELTKRGVTEIRGVPIEDFVVVSDMKELYENHLKPSGY